MVNPSDSNQSLAYARFFCIWAVYGGVGEKESLFVSEVFALKAW